MEPMPVVTPLAALPEGDALVAASVEELFEAAGAMRRGHFLLKSGRHSDRYLEKFAVLQYPSLAVEIGRRLAASFVDRADPRGRADYRRGAARRRDGASARATLGRTVRGVFAEPMENAEPEVPAPRLAGDGHRSESCWSDDILTTGASLAETVHAVRMAGSTPLVATVIVDRSSGPVEVGCPIQSLGRIEIASWPATECPVAPAAADRQAGAARLS
jgi:orotate phosphoribosyltransferase